MTAAVLGVIGGSGVYDLPGLEDVREEAIASPWGEPSDAVRIGRIGQTKVVFLARHGRGHRLSPSGINYRANIDVLKRAGRQRLGHGRFSRTWDAEFFTTGTGTRGSSMLPGTGADGIGGAAPISSRTGLSIDGSASGFASPCWRRR